MSRETGDEFGSDNVAGDSNKTGQRLSLLACFAKKWQMSDSKNIVSFTKFLSL